MPKADAVCRCVDLHQRYVASDSLHPEVPAPARRASSLLEAALTLSKSHMWSKLAVHVVVILACNLIEHELRGRKLAAAAALLRMPAAPGAGCSASDARNLNLSIHKARICCCTGVPMTLTMLPQPPGYSCPSHSSHVRNIGTCHVTRAASLPRSVLDPGHQGT